AAGGENLTPGGFEFATPPNLTNGLAPASNYIYDTRRVRGFGLLPGFNFNAFSGSFPTQERWGGYAAFEHKICDDQLRIYADFYHADAKTHDELAPDATGSFLTPGSPARYIPPNHPFVDAENPPLGGLPASAVGMPANAFN